jgi:hypothetical protein
MLCFSAALPFNNGVDRNGCDDCYRLVAGERRLRAARMLKSGSSIMSGLKKGMVVRVVESCPE